MDLAVLAGLIAVVFGIVRVAEEWSGQLRPVAAIHLGTAYLPLYLLYSLSRGLVAYVISLLFTLVYGYVAARVRAAERVMIPILDILQSIPVLGFLPGFVLGMVHLFPNENIGLEMASVLMIFTGQVWNLTFSFYSSLKALPEDFVAVSRLAKLNWWQRFFRLEVPYAATGLVWNSMMSMAGGWFFLTVSEAFVLGKHDFRLPGLGSYMSVAIERGDVAAQWRGVIAMALMIVMLDQLMWRPLVAWSQRFSADEATGRGGAESWLWNAIRGSHVWEVIVSAGQRLRGLWVRRVRTAAQPPEPASPARAKRWRMLGRGMGFLAIGMILGALVKYVQLLHELRGREWGLLWAGTGLTFLRVFAAVGLASLWTIPVGVAIGRSPRWSRRLQPIIQMVASFPAPMIYPVVVGLLLAIPYVKLGLASVVLLMLGTQWYVLFNVIAGAGAIPREFWEVARLARLSLWGRWRKFILPAIFPALLTGWVTAAGGAWNASIVAEYVVNFRGHHTLSTLGLGALISQATDHGQFAMLGAAVGIMAVVVVGFNRLVWRPLSHLAQTRCEMTS